MQLPVGSSSLLSLYYQIQQSGHLLNCMNITNFLNSIKKSYVITKSDKELSSENLLENLIIEISNTADIYILIGMKMILQSWHHF